MQDCKPKILIISSANPTKGPGVLATDFYNAFRQQDIEADVLTLDKCDAYPEFLYIQDPKSFPTRVKNRFIRFYRKFYRLFRAILHDCRACAKANYWFFYFEEEHPPVAISKVLSKINKQYDLVCIFFWQGMLSFATVRSIYRKLGCSIFFGGVDYSHMSGGCHFTGDCERYKTGCGCCPAFDSKDPHDFTWHNVNYRKKVYDEVKPTVAGNRYMQNFYRQSLLLKDFQFASSPIIIDTNLFRPVDKLELHERYGIPKDKTFKILFGCQSIDDERKGIKYLIEALNIFAKGLAPEECSRVLVMAIGKNFDVIRPQLNAFATHDFGYVPKEEIARIYAFADIFLCPSVNDAGPMMVNQSLCCGTPVVGFEMGSCLDAVKDKGTGYCAPLRDSKEFARGIDMIFRQSAEERDAMQKRCVELARNTYSYEAATRRILEEYQANRIITTS